MPRIAVFLDGSNFFYMQKDCLKWWIDPKKLLNWIGRRGEIVDATYYTGVNRDNSQHAFIKALSYMGYSVYEKPIKVFHQPDGSEKLKANLDVEIVTDMFVRMNNYDEACLISGDCDFVRPLSILRSMGKSFLIMSSKTFASQEIRNLAGMRFQDFEDIRELVQKDSLR